MDRTRVPEATIEDEEGMSKEYGELLLSLPRAKHLHAVLYKYQGYWLQFQAIKGTISFQKHFKARDTDIIVCTFPKSGTTWLKALVFTILNRAHYAPNSATHPLLTCNPHHLVRFFEFQIYAENENPNIENLPDPRIFTTHLPFSLLPQCISDSNCRVVYMCRNPMDQLISRWFFLTNLWPECKEISSIEEQVEMFQEGICLYGPFWDHVLEYWNKSLKKKDRILFLKYEDLKEDIISETNKLANFLGVPFSEEEEERGVVAEISRLCSLENLKELEVNKSGEAKPGVRYNVVLYAFFRKGEVGDWANYLSPAAAAKIEKFVEEKLRGSGLAFKMTS